MFINQGDLSQRIKKPRKLLLRAKPEEKDRLLRRAQEIFPDLEIVAEPAEQFLFSSLPIPEEVAGLEQKFNSKAQALSPELRSQAYFLNANGETISIFSSAPEGLYYGMLSLGELFQRGLGTRDFFDNPEFCQRGFLQDLSRGQVLNLVGFERLFKALSSFRYNWLTFNLEHNFGYEQYPEISSGDDQLSKDEARAIFKLGREYFIEVVPMQQSLGHLRGLLSKSNYQRLAFDEELLWSLDPREEEIYPFLSALYQEQAECFPGRYFLVGLDEPFDLKKNWKPESSGGKDFPEVYLEHLLKLNQILLSLGRRMMVWADFFIEHPELVSSVPKEVILINWQYGTSRGEKEEHYLERSKALAQSGRDFYLATCTWSYARLFPELRTMEQNNQNFLRVGSRLGAQGALLTNWGDLGHIQLLGYIALPIAYFGLNSWRPLDLSLSQFSKDFAQSFFEDESGGAGEFYLLLDRLNQIISPGDFFGSSALFVLLDDLFSTQYLPPQPLSQLSDQLLTLIKQVETLTSQLKPLKNSEWLLDLKPIIYALGILFSKLLIQAQAPLVLKEPSKKEEMLILMGHLSSYFQSFANALLDRWLVQAKPRGLERILRRLLRVLEGYQKRIKQLEHSGLTQAQSWEQIRDAEEFSEYKFNLLKELGLEGLL